MQVSFVCMAPVLFPLRFPRPARLPMEDFAIVGYSLTTCVQLFIGIFPRISHLRPKDRFKEGSIFIQMIVCDGTSGVAGTETLKHYTNHIFGYMPIKANPSGRPFSSICLSTVLRVYCQSGVAVIKVLSFTQTFNCLLVYMAE